MDASTLAFRNAREHGDEKPSDTRSEAQRDRDRILYAAEFRRLADITQVVSASEGPVFHNRLTHTLEVAHFGRRLAERLVDKDRKGADAVGGIDPDVVESACLAHDIGHPPFGHVAEQELRELVTASGVRSGFEGNAQSFRIVTKLAPHPPSPHGLNLTRATLNAILKYPWLREPSHLKWGAYDSEFLQLRHVRQACISASDSALESDRAKQIANDRELSSEELDWAKKYSVLRDPERSIEAKLMDWADDVTYAVHDAVDFYCAGLIPLDRLTARKDVTERQRFCAEVFKRHSRSNIPLPDSPTSLEQAFEGIVAEFPILGPFRGTTSQWRNIVNHSSFLIKRYIEGANLDAGAKKGEELSVHPEFVKEVFMLKQLTWSYVILNSKLATQQHGLRRIIRELFAVYKEAAMADTDLSVFPMARREQLGRASTKEARIRIIADLISGMSEKQAKAIHQKVTGIFLGSVLEGGTE